MKTPQSQTSSDDAGDPTAIPVVPATSEPGKGVSLPLQPQAMQDAPGLKVLDYDDGTAMKELIITEPAPGELMITGPVPGWNHIDVTPVVILALGLFLLGVGVVGVTMSSWPAAMVGIFVSVGLILAITSSNTIRTSRRAHFIHLKPEVVILFGHAAFRNSQVTYKPGQIKDVYLRQDLGAKGGQLVIQGRVYSRILFINVPLSDLQAAVKMIRRHVGLGDDKRSWYNKPII